MAVNSEASSPYKNEQELVDSIARVSDLMNENDQSIALEREMFLRKLREGLSLNAEDLRAFYNQAKPCAGEEEMEELIC